MASKTRGRGRPPKPTEDKAMRKLNVWLTEDAWESVKRLAKFDGRSLSDWARRVIEREVSA